MQVNIAPTTPAIVEAPPTARIPCLTSMFDIETVTQKPLEFACLNIRAPVPQARKAATGEMPSVPSIGSTRAAAVITAREFEPVTTCIRAAMIIGINIAGKADAATISAILSATPAFLINTASAPPIPVTIIGIAADVMPSPTQLSRTFFVFHSLPVSVRDTIQPVRRAASGLPTNDNTFAIVVSGTTTDATVFKRIRTIGTTIGAIDFERLGRFFWSKASLAAFTNSSFGGTGVLRVIQYNVAAITLGTAVIRPQIIACPRGTLRRAAAEPDPV